MVENVIVAGVMVAILAAAVLLLRPAAPPPVPRDCATIMADLEIKVSELGQNLRCMRKEIEALKAKLEKD